MNLINNLMTPVTPELSDIKITTKSNIGFIGSCFSTNLYNKFKEYYLNGNKAPFGNVYNPLSISLLLNKTIENYTYTQNDVICNNGIFQHHDFHSTYGNSNINTFMNNLNSSIKEFKESLLNMDFLIITFGTAYIYKKNNQCVNNCHKLPKDNFKRRVLTLSEIKTNILETISKLNKINPDLKFIFTLSPVRHLRDSPTENSHSKALLRVAIEEIRDKADCFYYPSYEIMMDQLRDYRWYADDMIHPSKQAIEYIVSTFINTFGDDEFKAYIKRVENLNKMINHNVFNKESELYQKFNQKMKTVKEQIKKDYPHLLNLQKL